MSVIGAIQLHWGEWLKQIESFLADLAGLVWGPWLLVLLLGTHLFLTIRLRFIQRYTFKAIRLSLARKREGSGDISHFGALMTALAATVGTGNIVGVATAVSLGGPGAVLWMWLTGVFGIATKYSEAVLAVKYRVATPSGQMAGGPMYALERGLKWRWLAVLFAFFTAIAAFGIGNMVQANSISEMLQEPAHLPAFLGGAQISISKWHSGAVMTALTAVVILGGIKSIARVCELLVPFMAIFYCLGCAIILVMRHEVMPETVGIILKSAFTGQAAVGGFVGAGILQAMRYGVARGLFSNESGLGSAPIVAAAAQTKNPVRQALVSSTGTFWDTVVICLMTGLVVVSSGNWQEGLKGVALTRAAFQTLGSIGPLILSVGLLTFVFSTILGWSYYGEKACEYLLGSRAIFPYRICWVVAVMIGSVVKLQAVWDFADTANALMAVPNLIALLGLNAVIVAETRKYLWQNRLDEDAGETRPGGFPVAKT
jgi:alanine or glycine:cation symporter, AGCS family